PETEEPITSMLIEGDAVWAATGPYVIKYLRGKEVGRVSNPLGSPLGSILAFGSTLLALTSDGRRLLVWNITNLEFQSEMVFHDGFTATHMLHPATYLNKVLIAGVDGSLQLWNIRTSTCIHKFTASNLLPSSSDTSAAITSLVQSPVIDTIGVGYASGEIIVYDIRADERLLRIFMRGGSVKALSFRDDGHPVLASASDVGHIFLWDLSADGRLLHTIRGAHDSSVTAMEWIPGQPVLISSGEDNSVKQWFFDSPTSAPRLLKFRTGHRAPPHIVRYYGEDGKQLLTASGDRSLRSTSVVRDSRSFELSQGSLQAKASALSTPLAQLKLPPITSLSYSGVRWKDWDDILTAHEDDALARTWSMVNKRQGQHTLGSDITKKSKVVGAIKSVCVSACGNFGFVGSSTGDIVMYNMQSGSQRRSFDLGKRPGSRKEGRSVTGIATDALNRTVIASTLDALSFFDFFTAKLVHSVQFPVAITSIELQRDGGLLAAVCDDHIIRLVDVEARRVVREFGGFGGRILDLTFSPDSRWLIACSLDSVIRTFDIPTGRLIDSFKTPSVARSVSFSPTSDFLATSHVDSVAVHLWANRAQYGDVSLRSSTGLQATSMKLDQDLSVLNDKLATLTLLPPSRWQTLLRFETIQQRNKAKEPPKAPEHAPFFLPSLSGPDSTPTNEKQDTRKKPTKRLRNATAESAFLKKLSSSADDDCELFTLAPVVVVIDIPPRRVVLPIRGDALTSSHGRQNPEPDDAGRPAALPPRAHRPAALPRDFEAVQTYLNVLLRKHGDVLQANAEVRGALEGLLGLQKQETARMLDLIAASVGTLAFLRDTIS
ncbi:hypothetical protein EWM64_g4973, partial [Hericium alpestre]